MVSARGQRQLWYINFFFKTFILPLRNCFLLSLSTYCSSVSYENITSLAVLKFLVSFKGFQDLFYVTLIEKAIVSVVVSSSCLTYFCRSALSARKSTVLVALCHSIRKVLLPNTPHSPLNRYSTISFTIFPFSLLQVYSIYNNRNKFHVTGR